MDVSRVASRTSFLVVRTAVVLVFACAIAHAADRKRPGLPMEIPVLSVKYFPVQGDRIDQSVTGDWDAPLEDTRQKTERLTGEVVQALQEGTRYHGYQNPQAKPSLTYKVVDILEFLEPLPTVAQPGRRVPLTDYRSIMERIDIRRWVEEKGVKEVWIWGYHGGVLDLWESNMSSPFGDVSNSNRDPNDLPVLKSTYTVYHYNYQRGASEGVEDHMHQFEAVFNYVDGRDRTPPDKWDTLLFWGKFVGSDRSHKIIRPGCGWSHYPPNAEQDYDWANPRFVETDIEDWKPDGTGKKQRLNCDRWEGNSIKWFVYWMQNLPGADNGLTFQGKPLGNWWLLIGDFDDALQNKMGLVADRVDRKTVPFPDAVDAAAISVEHLDGILEHALILGNGDVNALLYSENGRLRLRLTKNDVWDARLDTSEDPPLMPIRRIEELAEGDWLKGGAFGGGWLDPDGTPHRGGNSWDRPYPCPRPCADVQLGNRPEKPYWRRIRAGGEHDAFRPQDGAAVMGIAGRQGASNGYAYGPIDLSTDDHNWVRITISGTANAQFYVDVLDPAGEVIMGSKWQKTPSRPQERIFELPPGKRARQLILYTWTNDGGSAENRFESVSFEGPKGSVGVDLSLAAAPSRRARLDLRRAVAEVRGIGDDGPPAIVRALADRNVFLIESPERVGLVPFMPSYPLPETEQGQRDGVRWLRQDLPGDLDWPGMSYVVALAEKGNRKTVAIVTSLESKDPLTAAAKLARETLEDDVQDLIDEHEVEWRRFWARSGVDLDDEFLQSVWYRNLYFMRCVARPGAACVGLYAGLVDDRPAWHGSHTTNYNAEQTFWTGLPTNHPELTDPYVQLISDYLPRARWLCRQLYDCEGAYFPHNVFCHEPPEPEKCSSRLGRQQFYVTWSYTIGVSGFTVQNLWLKYKYQPDPQYLEKHAYPAVRDVALFYAHFIDRCRRTDDGRVVLAPSVSPEHWGWTHKFQRNRNCTFDIAMVRYTLRAAIEGATTLRRDAELVERWRRAERLLPDYPTTADEEPVVVDVQDAPPITYNIAVPAVPVFPADVVTWLSPQAEKERFARTIRQCRWNGNNSAIMLSVARARLSMPGTPDWVRGELQSRCRPNGTLTLNRLGHGINDNGHYTEQFAASVAVSELLLQSVGDVIRLFPAWPLERPARFRDLRAQGGFLVSAGVAEGRVGPVSITSTVGGTLRLLSPWPALTVRRRGGTGVEMLRPGAHGLIELETHSGERLTMGASGPGDPANLLKSTQINADHFHVEDARRYR